MAIPKFVRVSDYPFGIKHAGRNNALFLGFQLDESRPASMGRRVCTETVSVQPKHKRFYQFVMCLNTSEGIMAYDVSHGSSEGTWLVRYSISCPTIKAVVIEHKEAIYDLPEVPFTLEVKEIVGGYGRPLAPPQPTPEPTPEPTPVRKMASFREQYCPRTGIWVDTHSLKKRLDHLSQLIWHTERGSQEREKLINQIDELKTQLKESAK